ncbi:ABC transporter ATP-binding protein [Ornithinimicrobium cerasi]|uniref:ABC transporter ATP-binding protein n=1 Tax=Ornithinimicrobium cerasi TaxID=2248773 RepID=UPI000EFE01B6|nr:ABC transporter ATP-binding protein [Ornithinimicrobium cerasi]
MIQARALTKRYGRTPAVEDLSFTVRPGVVTGFLGPNGAGKSTTMRMVMGLDRPSSGEVSVGGRALKDHAAPLRVVGALLDSGAMHVNRSASHHLLALALTNSIPRARVEEVIAAVGLTAVARHRVGTFSLGMRQRLGVAAALLGDPEVLLLDEPVNGLDPEGILWIRQLLRRLAGEGRTVFVSSHLMSEMELTADHLVIIGRGRLLADLSMTAITASARPCVVIRSPQAPALREVLERAGAAVSAPAADELSVTGLTGPQVAQAALDHGLLVQELRTATTSLEDAYLKLTRGDVQYATAQDDLPDRKAAR